MFEGNDWDSFVESHKKYEDVTILKKGSSAQKKKKLFSKDCSIALVKYDASFNSITHFHEYFEIKYVLAGKVSLLVNNKRVVLRAGQMIVLEKGCIQEIESMKQSDELVGFLFDKESSINHLRYLGREEHCLVYDYLNKHFLKSDSEVAYFVADVRGNAAINEVLKSLIYEVSHLTKNVELIHSLSQVLFHKLARLYYNDLEKIYREQELNWTIVTVLRKIENDYQSLNLAQLSDELGYNMNYLSNLIKDQTGKTFKNLISEVRVKKAHDLLMNTDIPICQIAEKVGYSNKSYFYLKFEEYYGNTPLSFRKRVTA